MRNVKWWWFLAVAVAVVAAAGTSAQATTYNLTFGAPYAAASFITPSTAAQYLGAGSWYEQYPSGKTEIYVDPAAQFGASFTIDQIQSVVYHTLNDATNPSGVDFYMLIYTALESSDNDASWYNKRLNAEPYLSNGYVPPTAGVWNTWTTDAPTNQLTFFDANNNGGNFGFYGQPTLADLQAGAINWSTWPGNPTAGSADPNPIDYGAKTVKYLNWSTGSGWAAFAGYIDAIEINLTTGDSYVIDLEAKTDPVYVDDDWAGTAPGVEVEPGKFFGWNAFATIQDGINNVSGSTVYVAAGTYVLASTINVNLPNLVLEGAGAGNTIVQVSKAVGYAFNVTGAGSVIRGFTVEKTDLLSVHNLALINANNVTIENNEFFGPDPGSPWSVNGLVSRAMEVAGGLSGLVIQNNTIHTLRQPAYINPGTVGTVTGNHVYGTRGWVNDGGQITFTGNDWPCPGNQGADIALLASVNPVWYPDLFALSVGNDDAYISAQYVGGKSGRAYSYVDIAAAPGGNGHSCHPYQSAATGALNTLPTGTCYVASGVYEEQVEIKENITVQGDGMGSTIIRCPVALTKFFFSAPYNNYPVVYIHDVASMAIRDLTVDGYGRGNAHYRFIGVGFRNAGGVVDHVEVTDVRDTPFSGTQHGVGVYAYNVDGVARSIEVGNCSIHDFQKNAMALNAAAGTSLTTNVHDNTIVGYGATTVTAQNGIQIYTPGSSGSVTNNTVSAIAYDNTLSSTKWVATSILNFYTDLQIVGNTISQAHMGIYNIDGNATIAENDITIEKIGVYAFGIIASDPPKAVPSPVDEITPFSAAPSGDRMAASAAAVVAVDVLRNELTFSGMDNTATYAIEADAGYGPNDLAFYAAENVVTGFEVGVEVYQCQSGCDVGVFTSAKAYSNSLAGNTFGMRSNWSSVADGSGNWWGSTDPLAVAGEVSGVVDYSPWLDGNDIDGVTMGFQGDFSALWADDDSPVAGADHHFQEAVNMVSGSTIYLMPGTYVGQTVINGFADLDVIGSGVGVTIINPPATTMAYNYTTPSNNRAVIAIVNSDDVAISDLTVDGLGKGNINNRFVGIAFFESGGSVTDCEVKDIRNTPIDGIQGGNAIYGYNFAAPARTVSVSGCHVIGFQKGGIVMNGDYLTANVVDNDVDGYGPANFIAMNGIQIGWNAAGVVDNNRVYGCSYTGPNWSSAGILIYGYPVSYEAVQVVGNEVDECQTGIYFVNIGGNIDNNTVTNTSAGTGTYYWGIIADPGDIKGRKPQPFEETVAASSLGSMAAGVNAIATSATGNVLDGDGDGVGIGAYSWSVANGGEGTLNFSASNNVITEFGVGMELYEDNDAVLTSTLTYNKIFYNELGLYNGNGTVDAQFNSICYNTTNADDNTAGNYYNANCWSDWNGVQPYAVGGAGANVDNAATSGCGFDLTPDAIAYDCEGTFSVDVTIGESVTGVSLADVILMVPPSLTLVNMSTPQPGWLLSYSTPGGGQHNFTLQNASATLDGPAVLFTVTFSGSESCINSVIDMTYGRLYEDLGRTMQIPASLAPSVALTSDCADPSGITVNSPAPGACYGPAPVLDISATDDCDLDAVYYQIDGCAGTWQPIATGLTGTAYSNAAWEIPGYAGLSGGEHCVYFLVVDDFGRSNADACTFQWCFTRDLTGPEIVCPADFTVECEADIPACNPNNATATDACGGPVTITCSDGVFTGDPCGGTLTRTYTATDQFGNTSSCDQVITVLDTQAPVITCLPDISVQRLLDLPPCDEGDVTVTDNCGGAITVTCERSSLGGVGCSDVPALVYYTYTATDVCGNSATCQRVVTVLRPDCPFAVSAGDGSGVVNAFAGQTLTLPVNVDEISTEVSSFDLALRYDKSAVTVQSVDRGEALAAWEYFSYRLETSESDGSGIVRLIGMADLNNGVNPPLSAYMPLGAIANIRLSVNADPSYIGRSINLEPCLNGCTDNTVVTRSGAKTIVMAESDVEGCTSSLSGTVVTGVRFAGLRLDVAKPQSTTGDINLNGMGYEVGDIVVLTNYLVNGFSALSEDASLRELQLAASDVNADGVLMTVADLRYLLRVVAGEAAPIPGAKLSPYAPNAQAEYRIEDGRLTVSTNAAVDLGGALFIFRTEGLSVGSPALSEAAAGMNVRVNSGNGECRVLVSTTLESMASVSAGHRELFSVPVTGDGTADLIEVQMSDADGALLAVTAYKSVLPTDYALEQNYPNPFNAGTVIPFALKDASEWTVTIYNVMGQVVRTFTGRNDAGRVTVTWDGADHNGAAVSSGVYFYRVQTDNWHATKKMTLVK
ncbi:MAG TPA: T9SS type A sorting domain-containing protein [bacterium]|nr:T9SS type A sorting domain-containing protein [bacterium]